MNFGRCPKKKKKAPHFFDALVYKWLQLIFNPFGSNQSKYISLLNFSDLLRSIQKLQLLYFVFGPKNRSLFPSIFQEPLRPGIYVLGWKYSWLCMRFLFPLHRKCPENVFMSGWWHMGGALRLSDCEHVSSAFRRLFSCVQLRQLHRSFHRRRARNKSPAQSPTGSRLLQKCLREPGHWCPSTCHES